jgi:hypothetical protein
MKKEIRVLVFENESCCDELPSTPKEFLSWWQEKIDLVPEEYRDTTFIDCETNISWEFAQFQVKIGYKRPETSEEEAIRIKDEKEKQKIIENRELCLLEKLKSKYDV